MTAAFMGHTEVGKMLVETGADVNARNDEGQTALMIAREKEHSLIVDLLIEAGAEE
jgi:ankyrin repeat protein